MASTEVPDFVYFGDGEGNFDRRVSFDETNRNSLSVGAADMDGDGDIDLVVAHVGTANAVFFNQGDGRRFVESPFGGPDDITYWIAIGDVDADGYPDIAEANSRGANGIYVNRRAAPGGGGRQRFPGPPLKPAAGSKRRGRMRDETRETDSRPLGEKTAASISAWA